MTADDHEIVGEIKKKRAVSTDNDVYNVELTGLNGEEYTHYIIPTGEVSANTFVADSSDNSSIKIQPSTEEYGYGTVGDHYYWHIPYHPYYPWYPYVMPMVVDQKAIINAKEIIVKTKEISVSIDCDQVILLEKIIINGKEFLRVDSPAMEEKMKDFEKDLEKLCKKYLPSFGIKK
jgi:hypothetical protein